MPERLVIENILSAREAGAIVLNHTRVEKIEETGGSVVVTARDLLHDRTLQYRARRPGRMPPVPGSTEVRRAGNLDNGRIIFPTKGIHLVLPKLTDQALFVTSRDGRMFFIVPLAEHSLIGTTDTKFQGDLDEVHAEAADVEYLLSESRRVLPGLGLSREKILYTYAGVRPLAFTGEQRIEDLPQAPRYPGGEIRANHHYCRRQADHVPGNGEGRCRCGLRGPLRETFLRAPIACPFPAGSRFPIRIISAKRFPSSPLAAGSIRKPCST